VSLTLSTASPHLGSEIPELTPWNIRTPSAGVRSVSRARGTRSLSVAMPKFKRSVNTEAQNVKQTARKVTVTEGAISSSYEIAGLSTIPSDGSEHKVTITVVDLDAKLAWISAPRSTSTAFLQCRVKNTSNFSLIAGRSNVFMDGNFVAKAYIPDVSPYEFFNCSLGVDPAVRVTYHPRRKTVSHQGGTLLNKTKTEISKFSQRISIKNTRPGPLEYLIVQDQVPVSEDERIKVKVHNPSEEALGPMNGGDSGNSKNLSTGTTAGAAVAHISPGVTARWTQKDTEDDPLGEGHGPKGDGVLEWICTKMKDHLDLELVYEVSSPAGLRWERPTTGEYEARSENW